MGVYLVGTNVSQIQYLISKLYNENLRDLLQNLTYFIPNFEFFNLGTKIIYFLPVEPGFLWMSFGYAILLSAFFLFVAGRLIQKKEI